MTIVRLGLPQMLALSLALHGGAAAGYLLAHAHATAAMATTPETPAPTLILLGSEETYDRPALTSTAPVAVKPASVRPSVAALAPAARIVEKPISPVAASSSLALEANPNAHLRALPSEAVLSPNPAPHLDGRNGVVFVLDISGSMYEPCDGATRLTFARLELARRIRALADGTPFAVTLYAESARNSGPLVAAGDATREAAVRFVMRDIDCGGGTNLPAGLVSATQLAAGRLVLVSDGDLNISLDDLLDNASRILGPRGHGPDLTVIGIAPRPHTIDRQLLEELADQQGGTYLAEQIEDDARLLTSDRPDINVATP